MRRFLALVESLFLLSCGYIPLGKENPSTSSPIHPEDSKPENKQDNSLELLVDFNNKTIDDSQLSSLTYKNQLYSSLTSLPEKYISKDFVDKYFDEFFSDYSLTFNSQKCLPNLIVVNKSKFKAFYFGANETETKKTYSVGTGAHIGKKRTIAGFNRKDRVTPEGIFWVEELVYEPTKKYSNGVNLGPRVISVKSPGKRSPYNDIALHGTSHNVQWTIGLPRSFGCVRMLNEEIIDLYNSSAVGDLVIITP
ncbi:L,D-transpeptidase [Candidatus Woesearchaeota archaeon]|nr:L,D-transpeptidase [Candidatus Woesearchaeota archaeon]